MSRIISGIGFAVSIVFLLAVCIGWGFICGYALRWVNPIIKLGGLRK